MQHRPVLRHVDRFAAEHRVAPLGDAGGSSDGEQGDDHGVVDALLGVVDAQVADGHDVALGTARVGGEQVSEVSRRRERRERFPLRGGRDVDEVPEVHRRGP